MGDRVGWVDNNPIGRINEAINKKSKKLPAYKKCSRLDDICLMIIADRYMNSGKLSLEKHHPFDAKGFHTVYFFSYPENIRIIA